MDRIVFQVSVFVVVEGGSRVAAEKGITRDELRRRIENGLREEIRPTFNVEPFWKPPIRVRTILGIDSIRDWLKEEQKDDHKTGF
jgi:hypothetical protein